MRKGNIFIISSVFLIASCGGGGGGGSAAVAPLLAAISSFVSSISSSPINGTVDLTWSSSNATSCTASGGWIGSKATSGTESVTISTNGDNTFNLRCTGEGGNSGLSSLTIEGYKTISGVSVDGYISNASIFVDKNDNFTLDSDESDTTSGTNGDFTIRYDNGSLVSLGGTDLDTQNSLANLLLMNALSGYTETLVVTPVTSVASFICTNTSVACSGTGATINALLGIDSSIDINTLDPVASKGDGGIYDYLYEKGNQITALAYALQNISNDLNTSSDTTQGYFKAIAEELDVEYSSTSKKIDIENPIFITNVLENVITANSLTIASDAKANTIAALSSVLPIIQVKSTNSLTASIIRFATGTMQSDLVKIANGTQPDNMNNWYSSDGIISYIATTQSITTEGLQPTIVSFQDAVSTVEDTSVSINPLANDSFQTSLPILLTASGQTGGGISIANNIITYTPNANFNGSDAIQYTITQGSASSSSSISITISSVNDSPVINTSSTINISNGVSDVGTISTSDVDGDTLTLSLSGTDASSFTLSETNVLTFNEAPDYETKNSYSLTLSLTDGTVTVTKDITISIIRPRVIGYEVIKSIDVINTKE
jgi:hypothetical protein